MFWFISISVIALVDSQNFDTETPANITSASPCTDQNHLFLAPGVLTAGGTNRACISRFFPEGSAHMLVTLLTETKQTAVAFRELSSGDGGCLDITVPQLPNTKATLTVNVRYPEARCSWERSVQVRVSAGRVLVVHTERVRYRPGDTLRARVFALKADLAPAHGPIEEIWLEGPRGVWDGARAAQWSQVRTRLGIAQVQHDLDELAPPGKWTVRAKLGDGSQGSSYFWVGNYELPPFQLSVKHAARVLRSSERLVWTVCVRYPWTEAVEGMLVIRLRGAGGGDGGGGIRTAVRLRAPRACHRHAAAAHRIGLGGSNSPDVVVADFSFQEEGTRVWQNTTVVSQVVDKPVTLEFLTKQRAVITAGLPYKLKVKATRWDDKPTANEHVRVCRSRVEHMSELTQENVNASKLTDSTCNDAATDAEGVVGIAFGADHNGTTIYRFEATLYNDSSTISQPLFLAGRAGEGAALGPLRADSRASRSFVPLYLTARDVTTPITVHFVVITRGGIIYRWGATTQCPFVNSPVQIQSISRDSPCDAHVDKLDATTYKLDANESDALLERHLLRVMLPIKVTHQMCPDSHLIAYFYYKGELISAYKHFELDECLANKVEATWMSRQIPPGSLATLQLSTSGPALCALTVLDTATKLTTPSQSVKDTVLERLKRLVDGHRNLTVYDAAGNCYLNTDSLDYLPTESTVLTATWLAAAGVRIVGGDITHGKQCETIAPASLIADKEITPRSDFSEAWLWRLVAVGTNGSAVASTRAPDSITRYEATAVCVAKNGIGISPPAALQVFREFFVHADSPKRLRQGDSTIMRYRIFNYLYEPLSVQIQIIPDSRIEVPTDFVESVCIAARSSAARRVELIARRAGAARLTLRAKSVKDGNCGNSSTSTRFGVSDEVVIETQVEPEGVPIHEHKSTLLCAKGSLESTSSKVSWTWPTVQSVTGTEFMTVWAVGDITGPLFADADSLVLLPRGCGEQNMARLATNLLALQQLDQHAPAYAAAKEHVARGFTRQLQYIHPSGGFSAFGAADPTPSTWLTAFSVRYLRRAHQALFPGLPVPAAIERAERWLLGQQMENGCFRNEGQVFHKELKGGLNEDGEVANVALTAYVITSLLESSIIFPSKVLRNTISCLRALPLKTKIPTRTYIYSLLAYTFMKLKNYEDELRKTNDVNYLWDKKVTIEAGLKEDEELRELVDVLKLAKRSGDFVWWETGSLSTSIEATSYALLALSSCQPALREYSCAPDARAAIRWLSTHRNPAGGFVSTQDTLVALEALISWSRTQPSSVPNLNVTARTKDSIKSIKLQPGVKVPSVKKLELGNQLDVEVHGTGCALIQATRCYNVLHPDKEQNKLLSVQMSVHVDGPFNCDANQTSCFCAAVVEACVVWSGTFPEMALLEVLLPGGFGADASRLYSQLQHPNTLLRRIELATSSGRATLYLAVQDDSSTTSGPGHQCFSFHATGPRTRTKPGHARLQDYYRPEISDIQMFSIPEDCPPRISHESNEYLSTDNLFKNARSMADSGEIVISDEFTFEDIPEGIPLEDPLYDNLTQSKDDDIGYMEAKDNSKANKTKELLSCIDTGVQYNLTQENQIKESRNFTKNDTQEIRELKKEHVNNITDTPEFEAFVTAETILRNKEIFNTDSPVNKTKSDIVSEIKQNVTIDESSESTITISGIDVSANIISETEITPIKTKDNLTATNDKTLYVTENETVTNTTQTEDTQKLVLPTTLIDHPYFSEFHVITSDTDLEFPSGIEGPKPVYVLPPPNFQAPQPLTKSTRFRTRTNVHPYTVAHQGYQRFPVRETQTFTPYQFDESFFRGYRRYGLPSDILMGGLGP